MLKIHCLAPASHRNELSGVVESTDSLTSARAAAIVWTNRKPETTPGLPIEFPFESQTRNFAGTVEPCLNTLDPSVLIGCRIAWPGAPLQMPAAA